MAPQRVLAAVLFTDTVGFTKRTGENEEEAFSLLSADFAIMREVAARYEGQVKKSTGDGLLMVFQSAMEAVACAVEVQRRLGEIARQNPRALKHRIGIHLGDVYLSQEDVVGDGVNVANRLQSEAQPGGICFSQTVFDIVKAKLPIQARPLGERYLKNVKAAIYVYEIPPMFGPRAPQRPPSIHRPESRRSNSGLVGAIVFAGLCVLAGALIIAFKDRGKSEVITSPQRPPTDVSSAPSEGHSPPKVNSEPVSGPNNVTDDKPIRDEQELASLEPEASDARQSYEDERQRRKLAYDFDGMLTWIDAQPWGAEPNGKRLKGHWKRLKTLRDDLMAALAKTTEAAPLKVGDDICYLLNGTTLMYVAKGTAGEQVDFANIRPDLFVALSKSAQIPLALVNAFEMEYGLPPSSPGGQ